MKLGDDVMYAVCVKAGEWRPEALGDVVHAAPPAPPLPPEMGIGTSGSGGK